MRYDKWQAATPARSIVVHTPAKLNLFLEILSRRSDGYHELETLMVPISIRDTLGFVPLPTGDIQFGCRWVPGLQARRAAWKGGSIGSEPSPNLGRGWPEPATETTPWETLPPDRENLVVQALESFRRQAGVGQGARVLLDKRIPSAAGLGGASSDAAAALRAANRAWNVGWSEDRLGRLAGELGSDIPFFLGSGPARCLGRGERMEPLGNLPVLHFVVVRPPEGLSTAAVYRQCRPPVQPRSSRVLLDAWRVGNRRELGKQFHNRLQEAAQQLSPEIARLQAAFRRCRVLGHQMSGSGTSYFGLCHHARHARHVAGRLQSQRLGAVYCASSDRSFVSGVARADEP
jgi:4-diphosphocytidyl-2-C-methyl-D-erythritol kinase